MNKKLKTVLIFFLIIFITFTPMIAFAHSGRTDANGGHHDNKNKSGLGSYHYHCGGYPAHLHSNGVCPYATTTDSTASTSSSSNNSKQNKPVDPNAKTATVSSEKIKIAGNIVNNANLKYPFICYNNATYFPMTYHNKTSLGLTSETESGTIYYTTGNKPNYEADVAGSSTVDKKITATKLDYTVYIDQACYDYDNQWPLLKYNDIVYVPLTYQFADALDLTTNWTAETGLSITYQ